MPTNGRLDRSTLTQVDGWAYLEPTTARGWVAACDELVKLGHPRPTITKPDGAYRDYAGQVRMKTYWTAQGKPLNAATPGTSNHGWGTCVDIYENWRWPRAVLVAVMRKHGFVFDFSPEPWHAHRTGVNPADTTTTAALNPTPIKLPIGARTMIKMVSPTRGQAVIGAGYFRHLNTDEEVLAADLIVDRAIVGTDRQYDVWRSIVLHGDGANSADDETIKAAVTPTK